MPCIRALPPHGAGRVLIFGTRGEEREVRLPTQRKVEQVASLSALLSKAEIAIAADYQGMTVAAQTQLRQTLSAEGVQMRVVKNTLLRLAATEAGRAQFAELAEGPTALVVSDSDPVAAARVIAQYRREHAGTPFTVRKGVMGDAVLDAAYIEDLATVPPREELIARIAGGLTSKIAELAGLLQATTRDFASLIDARASQLEGQS
jgi:large subunit ribosomal protein L10